DSLARCVKGDKGETICSPSFLFKGAPRLVILSERAERARAKDLLVGSRDHRLWRTAVVSKSRSAWRYAPRPATRASLPAVRGGGPSLPPAASPPRGRTTESGPCARAPRRPTPGPG